MTELLPGIEPRGRARFSPCKTYRYTLNRTLSRDGLGICVFIMLNPSTADADTNDPTVRRCVGYADAWGYRSLTVLNAFAFRGTDPRDMKAAEEPVGPDNDRWIHSVTTSDGLPKRVIVAWGKDGTHQNRDLAVMKILTKQGLPVFCLGTNKDGTPRHPLYLKKDLQPTEYLGREYHRVKLG